MRRVTSSATSVFLSCLATASVALVSLASRNSQAVLAQSPEPRVEEVPGAVRLQSPNSALRSKELLEGRYAKIVFQGKSRTCARDCFIRFIKTNPSGEVSGIEYIYSHKNASQINSALGHSDNTKIYNVDSANIISIERDDCLFCRNPLTLTLKEDPESRIGSKNAFAFGYDASLLLGRYGNVTFIENGTRYVRFCYIVSFGIAAKDCIDEVDYVLADQGMRVDQMSEDQIKSYGVTTSSKYIESIVTTAVAFRRDPNSATLMASRKLEEQEARRHEEERLVAEAKRHEEERLAAVARQRREEEERLATEARQQREEEERLVAENKRREEERLAIEAKRREEERLAIEAKRREEERLATVARQQREEEERLATVARQQREEEERLATVAKRHEEEPPQNSYSELGGQAIEMIGRFALNAIAEYLSPGSQRHGGSGKSSVHVRGYHRKDGTYVRPYTRSRPDSGKKN